MNTVRKKEAHTRFRTVSPEQQGGGGVARPVKGNHSDIVKHAGDVVQRTYKEALKDLSKV